MAATGDEQSFQSPLKEFWEFVKQAKEFREYVMIAAVALPLVDLLTCFGPPWPNQLAVAIVTTVAELMLFMMAFQLWCRKGTAKIERLGLVSGAAAACFCIGYLYLFSQFIYPAPNYRSRVIGASTAALLPDIREEIDIRRKKAESRGYSVQLALADNGNDPDKIWERESLTLMRVLFVSVWTLLFCSVTLAFCSFLILQRKKVDAAKRARTRNRGLGGGSVPQAAADTQDGMQTQ